MLASRLRVVAAATAVFIVCTGALTVARSRSGRDSTPVTRDLASISRTRGPRSYETHGSVEQVWLTGAAPGEQLLLVDRNDRLMTTATADAQGSLIFRDVDRGRGYRVAGERHRRHSRSTSPTADEPPDAVVLRVADDRPRLRLPPDARRHAALDERHAARTARARVRIRPSIEYSGYSPRIRQSPQPSTLISRAFGFATVGVNIRGTGCSGGAFQFFETLQSTDGYDVIETIAAQPWVAHGKVGMVGISYPGISQLFTAATQPPHLAAIAPLSVIADTGRGTLRPGGIFNDGFAPSWASDRSTTPKAAPASGQGWAGDRIRGGDTVCASNQIAARPGARRAADDRRQPVLERPRGVAHARSCSSTRSTCPCSSPAPGRTSRPARTSPTCSTTSPAPTRRGSR